MASSTVRSVRITSAQLEELNRDGETTVNVQLGGRPYPGGAMALVITVEK